MPDAGRDASRHDRRSYWIASTDAPELSSLQGSIRADVVVIGAGIVGLTAALLLCEGDRKVVVLEADRVAAGVSGYTTAKLTAGHGLAYSRLEHAFGRDHARAYAESQTAAIDFIRNLCRREEIECDLEERANVVYAASSSDAAKLEEEAAAASRAGLSASLVQDPGLPFLGGAAALRLPGQAQFHVRKYLLGLLSLVQDAGAQVFENSRVEEISGAKPYEIRAARGTVSAPVVVVATHYPIVGQGFFATRIHPRRSYVVAAPLMRDVDLDGMFITAAPPTRSLRTAPLAGGGRLLLVGGEGHPVGDPPPTPRPYETLERFMHDHFDVGEVSYRWSTQDNYTVDGLPFVGEVPGAAGTYTATGFGGWGMSNGTLSAMLLADAITRVPNPWSGVYALERRSLGASARRFLTENTRVAKRQLGGPRASDEEAETLATGDGAILSLDGRKAAVSRGASGELIAVSAACTHMGCTVAWNAAESSWDCPCHGSRFAPDGRVLHGPATEQLGRIDLGATTSER